MDGPTPTTTARRLLVLLLLAGAALLMTRMFAHAKDRVSWVDTVGTALDASSATGEPVLMLFTADWCPPCRTLKAEVFSDAGIASRIEAGFEPVRIDLTDPDAEQTGWAERYEVRVIPALVATDAAGTELARLEGAVSLAEFSGWLDRVRNPSTARLP